MSQSETPVVNGKKISPAIVRSVARNPASLMSASGVTCHSEWLLRCADHIESLQASLTSCREALERVTAQKEDALRTIAPHVKEKEAAERRAEEMGKALLEISRTDGCTLEHMRNIASAALAKEAK